MNQSAFGDRIALLDHAAMGSECRTYLGGNRHRTAVPRTSRRV